MLEIDQYFPPRLPTLYQALEEMSGCVICTNVNGGNPYGNEKYSKKKKKVSEKKPGGRGADIFLGRSFKDKKKRNGRNL